MSASTPDTSSNHSLNIQFTAFGNIGQMGIKIKQIDGENLDSRTTILVAMLGEEKLGMIAYTEAENCLPYVSDLVVTPGRTEVAAMLVQRVRKECKAKGYDQVVLSIKPENPALSVLVLDGTFRIIEIVASCNT